jgi:hypothetical protein
MRYRGVHAAVRIHIFILIFGVWTDLHHVLSIPSVSPKIFCHNIFELAKNLTSDVPSNSAFTDILPVDSAKRCSCKCWSPSHLIRLFSMALLAHSGPRPLIYFRNHFSQTVGLLGRGISPSQGRYLNKGQHKHRINVNTHEASMPWVGFEPTIPASKRAKTVHALYGAATVTGYSHLLKWKKL